MLAPTNIMKFANGKILRLSFLLAMNGLSYANQLVSQSVKQCAPGCTERGNCNAETGQCECPWGYTGPACEVDRMAACRQTPDDPGSCGNLWPKSCECYKECQRLYCNGQLQNAYCTHELGEYDWDARCWMLNNVAEMDHRAGSRLPQDFKTSTTWYQHFPREFENYDSLVHADSSQVGKSNWDGGHLAFPLEACPGRCSGGRGVCFKWAHEQEPQCLCRKGFNGTQCDTVDAEEACWFSPTCRGRGQCRSGFCHCVPGFFGTGCHRSTAYQPTTPGDMPDVRLRSTLKIYMYELPWDIAFPYEYTDGHFGRDAMYASYEYFMHYFLQDDMVRTENPYEANLFYVPMLLYFYIGNVRHPVPHVTKVLDYVRQRWPFFNRTEGDDHFYFMTGDRGTCELPRWLQDSTIKLVHFGLQHKDVPWRGVPNKEYGCIQIKRDLVVPPLNMFDHLLPNGTVAYYKWLESNGGHDSNRKLLFFFAGGVGEGSEYSGGVRLAIKTLLSSLNPKPADIEFVEGATPDYRQLLEQSKFCVAPYGYGWGLRLIQAIEFGCIPLIIQDHVYQPFEDFLPYEEFSVRMRLTEVPHMVEMLRTFSEEQLAALRLGMAKYYRAFLWNREYGGQAYEWTLAGLQRRVTQMKSEYFHRWHRRQH